MVVARRGLTLEELEALPEQKPALEYIDGEVRQKPMLDGVQSSLQGELIFRLRLAGGSQRVALALPDLR